MATRSHIRFVEDSEVTQIFKMHDGDPEYMIPHFKEFFELMRGLDINEIVPSYITYAKLDGFKDKTVKEFIKSEWKALCLEIYMEEVTEDLPSDIAYFYIIDLKAKTIDEVFTSQTWSLQGDRIK